MSRNVGITLPVSPRMAKTSAVYSVLQNADDGARLVTANYGAENPRGRRHLKGAVIPVGTLIRAKSRAIQGGGVCSRGVQGHHYDTSLTIQHFHRFWRVKAHHCENEIRHNSDVLEAADGRRYYDLTLKISSSVSAMIFTS